MTGLYHYSILIRWDPRDAIFIAGVPELPGCKTHGATYEEALAMIQEAMDMCVEIEAEAGRPLPRPAIYPAPATVGV